MNPVDHPHGVCIFFGLREILDLTISRVVTINILVRLQLSRDTLSKVKRLVSSLLGELVCYVVLKRLRTKLIDEVFIAYGTCWLRIFVFPGAWG